MAPRCMHSVGGEGGAHTTHPVRKPCPCPAMSICTHTHPAPTHGAAAGVQAVLEDGVGDDVQLLLVLALWVPGEGAAGEGSGWDVCVVPQCMM